MKKTLKQILAGTLALSMMATLSSCSSGDGSTDSGSGGSGSTTGGTGGSSDGTVEVVPLIDTDQEGDLSIMVWSGDSIYYEDIGSLDWAPEDISTMNVAAVYAMAKKFNETYPNIKINLWAKTGEPNGEEVTWDQELENFKAQYGKYPDIYASTDLVSDTTRGLVADLSVYADDAMYQSFNKSIMNMMNYDGMQAGLPQYLLPWGVYVNKELADQNNIDIPDINWDIDEYTDFVESADNKTFYGNMDAPLSFINTGTKDINYALANGNDVDITTAAVSSMLEYVPTWSKTAVWAQYDAGNITDEYMEELWWWGYNFFAKNTLLAYDGDPWMMGSATMAKDAPNSIQSNDWDIYPRPSTEYMDNTVGIVIDPMAIHNYAMDDLNPEWSDAEKLQLDIAYTFASYWCGSTEALQARADQMFSDNGTLMSSMNDSFPLVTGAAFEEQMNIWYSTENHAPYGDAEAMPGFAEVLNIWEAGQFWDVSDKTNVYSITQDGSIVQCMSEWNNCTNPAVVEFKKTDAGWLDSTKSNLSDWNVSINNKFDQAEVSLKKSLADYYGIS
ncbi:MAG: ABC transporter substrate-binding protein [Eubacteriales bacterium]